MSEGSVSSTVAGGGGAHKGYGSTAAKQRQLMESRTPCAGKVPKMDERWPAPVVPLVDHAQNLFCRSKVNEFEGLTTNLWSGLTHVGTHGYVDEPLAVNWTTKGSVINQVQSSTTGSCAAFIGNLLLDCDTDDSTGGLMEKNAMSQQRGRARLRDAQSLIHRHRQQVTRRRHGRWTTVSSRRTPRARSPVAVTKAHGDVSEEPGVAWLGHDRLWPVRFGPIRFWPSCFTGQFWPVRFWPTLVFSVSAIFGQ